MTVKVFPGQINFRQRDPLSTDLFNCALEVIVRQTNIPDDLVLIIRLRKELVKVFRRLEKKEKMYGLIINKHKTNYIKVSRKVKTDLSEVKL